MSLPLTTVVEALKSKGMVFETGLTAGEFADIEGQYGLSFPPDLREFLSLGVPVSDDFPNWRTGKRSWRDKELSIVDLMDWPAEGMCFDVEHNGFWIRAWGPKPASLEEAFKIAREKVKEAPPLIPVFSHRFIPAEPAIEGNPVLSVHQTDIIYYGPDLASYFANECDLPCKEVTNDARQPRRIRFWSDIIDRADEEFLYLSGRKP